MDSLHQELKRPVRRWEIEFLENETSLASSSGDSPFSRSTKEGSDINTSCHSSLNDLNDIDNFETADSGLSSDAVKFSLFLYFFYFSLLIFRNCDPWILEKLIIATLLI